MESKNEKIQNFIEKQIININRKQGVLIFLRILILSLSCYFITPLIIIPCFVFWLTEWLNLKYYFQYESWKKRIDILNKYERRNKNERQEISKDNK